MRSSMEINHHNVPMIKFRALGTHYPTGIYKKAYNKDFNATLKWFVLEIDGLEITWYSDWIKEEDECHCGMYTKTECPMRDKCAEEEEE